MMVRGWERGDGENQKPDLAGMEEGVDPSAGCCCGWSAPCAWLCCRSEDVKGTMDVWCERE